jgi:hypothetical protein
MSKKKLLYVAPHLSTGGQPQYLYKQVKEFIKDFDIQVVEINNSGGYAFVVQKNRIKSLLKVHTLGEDKSEILKVISEFNPDIIWMNESPEVYEYRLPIPEVTEFIYSESRKHKIIETTHNNSFNFIHKGFNELLDIKNVIEKYNILDDDIIIKLTGRYKLLDNDFINIVKNNNKDAYVKFFDVCTYKFMHNATVLGLYAIKCKYQKNFNYDGTKSKSAETEFAEYVRANIDKNNLMEITNLNLEYCLYNDETNLIIV